VIDACRAGATPLREIEPGHSTACIRIEDIRSQLTGRAATVAVPAAVPAEDDQRDAIVSIRDVRKEFSRGGRVVTALDGVSVTVRRGESVGIVGESGSGKTTLGRCIVGLETPTGGSIRIGEVDASDYASLDKAQVAGLRARVQMAFQDPFSTLSPARAIGATLREAIRLDGVHHPRIGDEVVQLLDLVGLPAEYAKRKPTALSGGERQRVALARALARKPDLIVCDEIVSALDVSVQAQILTLLARLQSELGVSYLFITHDLAVVRQVTDRLYVLRNGRLVESGSTEHVLEHPAEEYTKQLLASVPSRENLIA
jgi:peptide/nickel transport system ATP-binding protein